MIQIIRKLVRGSGVVADSNGVSLMVTMLFLFKILIFPSMLSLFELLIIFQCSHFYAGNLWAGHWTCSEHVSFDHWSD
jgi:hypothetical protein